MPTYRQTDLVNKALEKLGVLPEGGIATPEQASRISGNIPGIIAILRSDEVYYLGSLDAIPDDAYLPLGDVVAWECRNSYGVTGEDLVPLQAANDEAIRRLRRFKRGRPTYEPLKTDYL